MKSPRAGREPSAAAVKRVADRAERKSDVPKRGVGRPTLYTKKLGEYICEELKKGRSLNSICSENGMPDESRVRDWAADPEHAISPNYVQARMLGYARMADELERIADGTDVPATHETERPERTTDRDRLRVDTRKWLLSKCLPKIYGDKLATSLSNPDGTPIEMSDTESVRRIAFMLGRSIGRSEANAAAAETAPTEESADV